MIPTFEFQIRFAKPGDEPAIHDAHMRSIREICVKDHGTEEIKGWGHRELGDRWTKEIQNGTVWVVERNGCIHGVPQCQDRCRNLIVKNQGRKDINKCNEFNTQKSLNDQQYRKSS